MLGQSFLPGADDQRMQQQEGAGPVNPVQEAIKVLSLKIPRYLGAQAPAPPQLLNSMGGGALQNPLAQLILQQFMPHAGGGGSSPMPGATPAAPPPGPAPNPVIHYMPNPGGTATGTPQVPRHNESDLPEPLPAGQGRRPRSV